MNSAAIMGLLTSHRIRIFTTGDLLTLTRMNSAAGTHALRRLEAQGLVMRIKRSVWINRAGSPVNPYEAVPYLRAPWPTYVSLYSALADSGAIEEIPQIVYAVSAAMPRRYKTLVADYSFHHLPIRLIWGFHPLQTGGGTYPVAEPEKAFLDLAYLALTPRSSLGLPRKRGRRWELSGGKVRSYTKRFGYPPLSRWIESEKFR